MTGSQPSAERMPAVEGVGFRPETKPDIPFLREAFHSSRDYELDLVQWEPEQRRLFMEHQFHAQRIHYTTHYPDAGFYIMEMDGKPIGRIYVDLSANPFLLMDIIVVRPMRNKGIGTRVIEALLRMADEEKKRVRIYVEKMNPALRMYQRLGFVTEEDTGPHYLMYYTPPGHESRKGD